MVKLVDVTPNAVVRRLPRTLPVMKLAMCKLMSMPNTVASTPCRSVPNISQSAKANSGLCAIICGPAVQSKDMSRVACFWHRKLNHSNTPSETRAA